MISVGSIAFLSFHFLLAWIVRAWNRRQMIAPVWAPRWLSLRHPQDEAIEGLRILPRVSFPIFGKEFAAAPFTLVSLIAFPVLIMTVTISSAFADWIKTALGSSRDPIPVLMAFSPFTLIAFLGYKTQLESYLVHVPDAFGKALVFFAILLGAAFYLLAGIILVAISRFIAIVVYAPPPTATTLRPRMRNQRLMRRHQLTRNLHCRRA
jgi:hypothetical protein